MPPVHRNNDPRVCGAVTVVGGQNSVYANNELVAVNGDPNSHALGNLIAGSNEVYVNSKAVVNHTPDLAVVDGALHPPSATRTAGGSPNVNVGD